MMLPEIYARIDCSGGRDACWPWRGAQRTNARGVKDYCMVRFDGKVQRLNRVLWTVWFGPIPDELLVCHTCDNPPCCNWRHWWLGTNAENMADMAAKGRAMGGKHHRGGNRTPRLRGADSPYARLTADQVRAIRAVPDRWGVIAALACEYGVSHTAISKIRRGVTYVTV